MAVHPTMKLQHFLMVRINRKSSSAVPKGPHNIANVLMERRSQMQQVHISFECNCPWELFYGFLLLVVIHQHCPKIKRKISITGGDLQAIIQSVGHKNIFFILLQINFSTRYQILLLMLIGASTLRTNWETTGPHTFVLSTTKPLSFSPTLNH